MEAITEEVLDLLGSLASKQLDILCNFRDDLNSMRSMVSAIKAVLRDAEAKAPKSELINDWLEKLKDILLEAEDLLDAYSADELAREVMTQDKKAKEVRIFFSKSNRIACAHKIGRRIRAIKKKLHGIYLEKNQLQLLENSLNTSSESHEWRQTHSFVREEDVVGRDEEKKSLVRILLDSNVKNNVSVVPIVGIGGLGKTTLAQQVYNDVAVQNHFELKMWVCVSDESQKQSIKKVTQKIIGCETNGEMDQLAVELRRKVDGQLFLLVLDDIWNEDREEWLRLENLLRGGKKGSMIIVTTRSETVAQIMGTHPPLHLEDLDLENSWKLFCKVAFRDGKEPNSLELIKIGKDIVKKCAGVPLAIRTIGSLLFTRKLGVDEWSYFRDNNFAEINLKEKNILPILKLSYDHLPSHMKNCFGFCSLFPKDYNIKRKTLIQLWIAEGFIQPLDQNRLMEDVGDEYFKQLLSRGFFQDVILDLFGDINSCKMHDLMHDLAQSVTKNECYMVTSERTKEEHFGDRIRHVSSDSEHMWEFPTYNVKINKVRTIMSPYGGCDIIRSHLPSSKLYASNCGSKRWFPKHLRVLDASWSDIREIPESIGELKHLRYLDLSRNFALEKLPRGITKLHNLQSLKLSRCSMLRELPKDIKKMVSLRHLEVYDCDSLICMPCGLGCLTKLQTLTFVVDQRRRSDSSGARINELRDLNSLSLDYLTIENIGRQRSNTKEVESAKLLVDMPRLRVLQLIWLSIMDSGEYTKEDEIILDALEPPHTIKSLYISGFCGKRFPEWIGSLPSLQVLTIDCCPSLEVIPDSIKCLTSLQHLQIEDCSALESLPESIGSLTSLRTLELKFCFALATLPESIKNLTSLQHLEIIGCPALMQLEGADWPGISNNPRVFIG